MLDDRTSTDDGAAVNTDVMSFRVSPQHPHYTTSKILKSNSAVNHAKGESSSPQDTEYEFIVDFLNGFKPFAIKLQETSMSDSFTLSPPPPASPPRPTLALDTAPKVKLPSFATRRAACTHLTMERLYGEFKCNVCSRCSSFGWVYRCTQDELPESQVTSDSASKISTTSHQRFDGIGNKENSVNDVSMAAPGANEDAGFVGEDMPMPTTQLSPWIENAISDGHYTPEQIVKLRAQKQHVVDTATEAIYHFEQSQTPSTNSSPQTPTTLPSVDSNPHLPSLLTNQVQEPSPTSLPTTKGAALAQHAKARMFPICKFRACQPCRPTHCDRAWLSLDDVFEKDREIPLIHYEEFNRPLASRSIMSTIGLHAPPPPTPERRPTLRSNDSRFLYSRNDAGEIFFNNNNNSSTTSHRRKSATPTASSIDIADDASAEAESKGFRESMKRAFKSMLVHREPSSRSTTRKRSARAGTDTTDEDTVEFDMGLWKELNDELLKEASGVPLPEKDSMEGLGKEVAVVGLGGVAVTEEAADLGTADVILSA